MFGNLDKSSYSIHETTNYSILITNCELLGVTYLPIIFKSQLHLITNCYLRMSSLLNCASPNSISTIIYLVPFFFTIPIPLTTLLSRQSQSTLHMHPCSTLVCRELNICCLIGELVGSRSHGNGSSLVSTSLHLVFVLREVLASHLH